MAHIGFGAIGPGPEFGWDGVGTEPGRDDLDRALAAQPVRHLDESQLGLEIEPVARLASTVVTPWVSISSSQRRPSEVGLRRGTCRGDRGQDPATRGEDVEIGRALLAEDQLVLARTSEEQRAGR